RDERSSGEADALRRRILARLVLAAATALALAAAFALAEQFLRARAADDPLADPPPHFRVLPRSARVPVLDARARRDYVVGSPQLTGESALESGRDRLALTKEKDPGVFRILSLGESTTFGLGYDGIASYSRFLEARLRARLARDDVEVVNCGRSGYDSHDW